MNESSAKQQLVEAIKSHSNIMVAVSDSPGVDELSAAIGLTILLNKLDKRATAIFSGAVPPAITFLDPEKTFEGTVDSLRDFIIALDKEKADHLRYKVEGDVVRIFITPYRTTLSEKDLDFTQGDYNVELVIALNVADQGHLDHALEAHGRILHDATVSTVTSGTHTSRLGSIDWHDDAASSLCEMLVGLSEALGGDAKVLDEQISTAFLTGIVSATDRFSNNFTSSRVMTMAAQLMAAGANQQLVAAKLQEAHEIGPQATATSPAAGTPAPTGDNTTTINLSGDQAAPQAEQALTISREASASTVGTEEPAQVAEETAPTQPDVSTLIDAAIGQTVDQPALPELPPQPELEAPATQLDEPVDESLTETAVEPALALPSLPPLEEPVIEEPRSGIPVIEPLPHPEPSPEAGIVTEPLPDNPEQELAKQLGSITELTDPALTNVESELAAQSGEPVVELPTPDEPEPVSADSGMPGFEALDIPAPVAPPAQAPVEAAHTNGYMVPEAPTSFNAVTDQPIDPFDAPLPSMSNQQPAVASTLNPIEQPLAPDATQPALPPLPDFSTLPPLPTPPPPPVFDQPQAAAPVLEPLQTQSGAISGDIFGDSAATTALPADESPVGAASTPPPPGQYRIPGQ